MSDDTSTRTDEEERELLDLLFGTTVARRLQQFCAKPLDEETFTIVSLSAAQTLRAYRMADGDPLRALDDFIKTGEMEL